MLNQNVGKDGAFFSAISIVSAVLIILFFKWVPTGKLDVATVALIISVITFIAVLIQIFIANKQLILAKLQTQVIIKQQNIIDRRAKLYVVSSTPPISQGRNEVTIEVGNAGNRTLKECRIRLMIPLGMESTSAKTAKGFLVSFDTKRAAVTQGYRAIAIDFSGTFLYPNSIAYVGKVLIIIAEEIPKEPILWQVVHEDGYFPTQYFTALTDQFDTSIL